MEFEGRYEPPSDEVDAEEAYELEESSRPRRKRRKRPAPGKVTRTLSMDALPSLVREWGTERARESYESREPAPVARGAVQADGGRIAADDAMDPFAVHLIAREGVSGSASTLPHLAAIQRAFGHHDVSGVRAHIGGGAAAAAEQVGARAYATGDDIAFATSPDLRQAAHEAAHVVQQRAGGIQLDGGVSRPGDVYETHADAVADLVVRGESAEALLDTMAHRGPSGGPAVQRDALAPATGAILMRDTEGASSSAQTQRGSQGTESTGEGTSDTTLRAVRHVTVRQAPSGDNSRTRVGVGEQVNFSAEQAGQWQASAERYGNRRGSGTSYTWVAPERPGSVTITFTPRGGGSGGRETLTFDVVAPTGVSYHSVNDFSRSTAAPPWRTTPQELKIRAGMQLQVKLLPLDVSFEGLFYMEGAAPASGMSGFWSTGAGGHDIHDHPPSAQWFVIGARNVLEERDTAALQDVTATSQDGYFQWLIPNLWSFEQGGSGTTMPNRSYQRFYLSANMDLRITKGSEGGHTASVTGGYNGETGAAGRARRAREGARSGGSAEGRLGGGIAIGGDSHDTVGNTLSATGSTRTGALDDRSRRRVYERIAELRGRNAREAGEEFAAMSAAEQETAMREAVTWFQTTDQGRRLCAEISGDNDAERDDGSHRYERPREGARSEHRAPTAEYTAGEARLNDVTMQALANAWPQTILGRLMNEQQAYEVLRRLVIGRSLPFNAAAVNVIGMRAYQGGAIHDNGEGAGERPGGESSTRRVFTHGNRYDDTTFLVYRGEGGNRVMQSRATVDPGGESENEFRVAADQQWDYVGNAGGTSAKYDRALYGLAGGGAEEVHLGRYWQQHPEEVEAAIERTARGEPGRIITRESGRVETDRMTTRGGDSAQRLVSAVHSGGGGGRTGETTGGDSIGCTVVHGAWFAHFNETLRRAAGGDSVRFTYSLIDPRTYTQLELDQILDSVVPRERPSTRTEGPSIDTPTVIPAAGPAAVHPDGGELTERDPARVQAEARRGVAGSGGALPHRAAIQASFGHHDVSGIRAHVGGAAADASAAIGARAYATGDDVAFAGTPDLRQAAHEAAHVMQHRGGDVQLDGGGVGRAGDPYERHADAVADAVVRGESAAPLLDGGPDALGIGAAGRALGHDFSDVEVRVGDANGSGHDAYAAFEGGRDVIAFDETSPSREQVAHELVHVAQRRGFGEGSGGVATSDSAPEVEARDLAPRVAAGEPVGVQAAPAGRVHFDAAVARRIHEKLHGWIDDEAGALTELRNDRTRRATIDAYQDEFHYSIWGDFQDNASGAILTSAMALLWPHMTLLERLDSMTGIDDDETGILQTIQNASVAQRQEARSDAHQAQLLRFINELDPPDAYTARRLIWPEPHHQVRIVLRLLEEGNGMWDDEGPAATAILNLTPTQRAELWNNHRSAFAMFNATDLARIERMCVNREGEATTDAAALRARMELATEGAGTDEEGVIAAVGVAGARRDERARLERQIRDRRADDGSPLSPADLERLRARYREIGGVERLLTPREATGGGHLDENSFLGRVEGDMDAATVDAAMVTAHATAKERAKQALLLTEDWMGNVDEAAVLRILREIEGEVELRPGERITELSESEIRRRRDESATQIRHELRTDPDLHEIFSALGDAWFDDGELAEAEALASGDAFAAVCLQLTDAFDDIDTDEGRILRVLRDTTPEIRQRLRDERPDPIPAIRRWATGGDFAPLFEDVLRTGIIPTQDALDYGSGGWGDGTDEEMVTDAIRNMSDAERRLLRRGYLIARTRDLRGDRVCAPGITPPPEDQRALDRWNAFYSQMSEELTDEELDAALASVLDIPTVGEIGGTDAQGRLDMAAIMLHRQRDRLQLHAGLTDFATTTDDTAEAAHVEFEARYNEALEDGDITPDEFNVLVTLDTTFNQRFAEYSATANMVSEIAGTVAAVVAAAVVIIASGGTATAASPGVVAWLSANSTLIATSAATSALAQVATSEAMGGSFNEALDEEGARQALSGAINGALAVCGAALAERAATLVGLSGPSLTAAMARAAADSAEIAVAGRAFARGALTGLIDGSLGGAIGELAMTLTDAQTWRQTVWGMLARAGESLLRGGLLGGATGGLAGGLLESATAMVRARIIGRTVPVAWDESLGSRAHLDVSLTPEGTVTGLGLRIGRHASDVDVAAHVDRAVAIHRADSLLTRARAAITGVEPPPAGTVSGNAAHEVEKIRDLIQGRLRQLRHEMAPAERAVIEAELDVFENNLERYTRIAASGDMSPATAGIAQPTAPDGFPAPPPGHYYRRTGPGPEDWDIQRYPGSTVDPLTMRRNAAGVWEPVGRDGRVARPAEVFPEGTTPQAAFDQLTDPEGSSTFRAYWEMVRDNHLATEREIVDELMQNPSGATVDSIRHDLKVVLERRLIDRARFTPEGVARTEAESMAELRRMTEGLDGSDRGNIMEEWYRLRRPGVSPHPSMTNADNPGLVTGREGRGVRRPDFVEGDTLVEMKAHRTRLSGDDVAQLQEGLRVSGAGGVVRLEDGTTRVVNRMRVVFPDIRGARLNGDRIAGWIRDNAHLTVEVFDSTGAARSLSQSSLPGFFERYSVDTVEALLAAM